MRLALWFAILIGAPLAAYAGTGPTLVVPGRAGVPVIINGRDASFAVVEGDWGLARSFNVQPTVYGGWWRYHREPVGHYYPSAGRVPGYGRYEVEPPANRKLPKPAASYHKSWSARSAPPAPAQPPMLMQPDIVVPLDPPPVIRGGGGSAPRGSQLPR